MLDYRYEEEYRSAGFKNISGVDEAGRGCLCGPVCAAAVILPPDWNHPMLNDSKKLTPKKRDQLFDEIKEHFPKMQFEPMSSCAGLLSLQK